MNYQIWVDSLENLEELTLVREDQSKDDKQISESATLYAEFEAASYDEAVTKMHEIVRFKPCTPP